MQEWKTYRIGDICKRVCSGGTPKSTEPSYYDGEIPWLNTKEINFNRISSTEKHITLSGLENSSAKWIDKNSVIVAMYGATAAKVAINTIPLTTNQACCNLSIDETKADYRFVYYWLCSRYTELASLANGGAQQNLNAQQIKDFEIKLPEIQTQQKIADLLWSIDNKIICNKSINDNLEQQAEALYKSWFVDFEPFKDGKFIESELGQIPEGWRIYTLNELMDIKRGSSPRPIQSYLSETGLKWLKISDATSCNSPFIYEIQEHIKSEGLRNTVYLQKGALVLSNSATPGLPKILGIDTCIHDGWLYFPISKLSNPFMYLMFIKFRENLISRANGSVFLNLKTEIVKNLKIALPKREIIEQFDIIISSVFNEIRNRTEEMLNLSKQRDTLLPKLMSGELKINEIDC